MMGLEWSPQRLLAQGAKSQSWYPFRAYLEKQLSYGIDGTSRRKQTNKIPNNRNTKEKKRETLTPINYYY